MVLTESICKCLNMQHVDINGFERPGGKSTDIFVCVLNLHQQYRLINTVNEENSKYSFSCILEHENEYTSDYIYMVIYVKFYTGTYSLGHLSPMNV